MTYVHAGTFDSITLANSAVEIMSRMELSFPGHDSKLQNPFDPDRLQPPEVRDSMSDGRTKRQRATNDEREWSEHDRRQLFHMGP